MRNSELTCDRCGIEITSDVSALFCDDCYDLVIELFELFERMACSMISEE